MNSHECTNNKPIRAFTAKKAKKTTIKTENMKSSLPTGQAGMTKIVTHWDDHNTCEILCLSTRQASDI